MVRAGHVSLYSHFIKGHIFRPKVETASWATHDSTIATPRDKVIDKKQTSSYKILWDSPMLVYMYMYTEASSLAQTY